MSHVVRVSYRSTRSLQPGKRGPATTADCRKRCAELRQASAAVGLADSYTEVNDARCRYPPMPDVARDVPLVTRVLAASECAAGACCRSLRLFETKCSGPDLLRHGKFSRGTANGIDSILHVRCRPAGSRAVATMLTVNAFPRVRHEVIAGQYVMPG